MRMADGRTTTGESWRQSVYQDFFEDINSPELIQPEVPLNEKMEMWKLYVQDLKTIAKEGTDQEKELLNKMFGLTYMGEAKDLDSPFEDIDEDELLTNKTVSQFNLTPEQLEEKIKEKVPKHAFYDLYNLFFTPKEEMKIKSAPEELRWMEKLLMNSNNPYTKAITENIPIYSYIVTTEIIKHLLSAGIKLDESMNQQNNQNIQKEVEKAMEKAQETMGNVQDIADTVGAGSVDADLSFSDMADINEYYRVMKDVPLKDEFLQDFIKKTLKLSRSYFSSRYTEVEENIFEVDQLEDLEGLENLFEPLNLVNLGEISTHERIYHHKVNLYIDRSGSMGGSYSYRHGYGTFTDRYGNLEELGMAKLTALKLKALGEVDEVRAFDHDLHETPLNTRDIIFLRSDGGTSIDKVIKHVVQQQTPSIILTDMADSINSYSPDVYFIGVGSARFSNFLHSKTGETYIKKGQCVKYDGANHVFTKVTLKNVKGL